MKKKFADVSNLFADVSIFAELAILRINKHKTMTNTLIKLLLMRRKEEKHSKSAKNGVLRP